jgi:hypothetical protein
MIRIGFSTVTSNLVSRIIRWFSRSKASHAWLLVSDETFGLELVMEASEMGFRLVPFESFKKKNTIVALFDPVVPLESGVKEAATWLGESYDFLGLFGALFVILGRWLKRKWKNPFHSSKSMFCSEAVVRVLQSVAYPGTEGMNPDSVTPQDLLDLLSS